MRKGRLARIAMKGQGHVKQTKNCSFGDRTDGRAYGAELVSSGVFNNRLEPYGGQGHGSRRPLTSNCRPRGRGRTRATSGVFPGVCPADRGPGAGPHRAATPFATQPALR